MLRLAVMLAASAACSLATGAPAWPSAPVQILTPLAQGGVPVGYARIVSKQLSTELGQPFTIEPGPAMGVSAAAQRLAGSVPDGLTLLFASYTHHGPAPELPQQKDFEGVGRVGHIPLFMVIRRASALSTVAGIVRAAKEQSGAIAYGSGDAVAAVTGAMLERMGGARMKPVAYKNTAAALAGVMRGRMAFVFADLPASRPLVQSGRALPIAVAALERSTLAPDVPSMAELGYPEFELPASFGVFAPKGTPELVIARLHFEMTKILARPDVRQSLALIGVDVNPGAPAILARTQSTFLYQ